MPRNLFRSELETLIFALRPLVQTLHDPVIDRILRDLELTIEYSRLSECRRFLIWGLLIGRDVDSFTSFFLSSKRQSITNPRRDTFNNRINQICRTTNPLTSDPRIRGDLHTVRGLRNDLFHRAGKHFTPTEMQTFVFNSVKCIQQLIRDV